MLVNNYVGLANGVQSFSNVTKVLKLVEETIDNQLGILFVYPNRVVFLYQNKVQECLTNWKAELLWVPVSVANIGLIFCHPDVDSKVLVDARGKMLISSIGFSLNNVFQLAAADLRWLQNKLVSVIPEFTINGASSSSNAASFSLQRHQSFSRLVNKFTLLSVSNPVTNTYVGNRKSRKGHASGKPPKR